MFDTPRFSLGHTFMTPGAQEALKDAEQHPWEFLGRHVCGDWGEVDTEDAQENERSLLHGWRILSAYSTTKGERIWILTERDRSSSTILLPEEY
jgi:hypothetical protein